jgi:predicted transcriptional regulator
MDDVSRISGPASADHTALTAEIVSAYVSKNSVRPTDLPELLSSVHTALSGLNRGGVTDAAPAEKLTSAQIRKSITHDALISFEDGRPYKTLRRHLTIKGLTPEAYRAKWGLPRDYPMTAVGYSEVRSAMAKSLGLGHQRRKYVAPDAAAIEDTVPEKPKRFGRSQKTEKPAGA